MIDTCGYDVQRRLERSKIVCAGTIIGGYDPIIAHIEQMCGKLEEVDESNINSPGPDQSIHNYLAYLGDTNVEYHNNKTGPILTTARLVDNDITINHDGIVNDNGLFNVIHHNGNQKSIMTYKMKLLEKL